MSGLQGTPEIDIKLADGQYGFSIGTRLMFATDSTMLHGSLNSTLMDILEKLDTGRNIEGYTKRICMTFRTGITAYAEGLNSMAESESAAS